MPSARSRRPRKESHQLILVSSMFQRAKDLSRAPRPCARQGNSCRPRADAAAHFPAGHYGFASFASERALLAAAEGKLSSAQQLCDLAVSLDEAAIQERRGGSLSIADAAHSPIQRAARRGATQSSSCRRDPRIEPAARACPFRPLVGEHRPGVHGSWSRAGCGGQECRRSQSGPVSRRTPERRAGAEQRGNAGCPPVRGRVEVASDPVVFSLPFSIFQVEASPGRGINPSLRRWPKECVRWRQRVEL